MLQGRQAFQSFALGEDAVKSDGKNSADITVAHIKEEVKKSVAFLS
jgi:hypothetical protein